MLIWPIDVLQPHSMTSSRTIPTLLERKKTSPNQLRSDLVLHGNTVKCFMMIPKKTKKTRNIETHRQTQSELEETAADIQMRRVEKVQ